MRDFRIVVAAHGGLAHALVATAELICGPIDDVHVVGLDPADSPEDFRSRLLAALGPEDGATRPVLILADLPGGTPHNVSCAMARRLPDAVLISGVNLAVLIEAATSVEALDEASTRHLVETGREALVDLDGLIAARSP
jgi:mannose/fructose-specific phosphotransferase system component IIA